VSPIKQATGPKGKCDAIFSKLVRERGACERCGSTDWLQCCHIISRRFNRTRCDLTNAYCGCGKCHAEQGANLWHPSELIGWDEYDRLRTLANDPTWRTPRSWWVDEFERLRAVEREQADR
jgi:hypothetical protein